MSSPVPFAASSPAAGARTPSTPSSAVPRTPSSQVRSSAPTPPSRRGGLDANRYLVSASAAAADEGSDSTNNLRSQRSSAPSASSLGGGGGGSNNIVWGTSVSVSHSIRQFERFLRGFVDERTGEPLYPRLISEAVEADAYNLNVDARNLHEFDPDLYREIVRYPQELVPVIDLVVHHHIGEHHPEAERSQRTQVRLFNLAEDEQQPMRDLDPDDIDKLVSLKGMVIRVSAVFPELRAAFFRCSACRWEVEVAVDRGRVQEPTRCQNCQRDNSMALVHNRSTFTDKQMVKLQETPDKVPEGETPHTVSVYTYDDLVDVAKPGDRVTVTGIFKARAVRANPRRRAVSSVYHTYVDAIHFRKNAPGRFGAEDSKAERSSEFHTPFEESDEPSGLGEERQRELQALAAMPDIYERLTRSLAPSIYQLDDVKKAVLCQLFGGTNKDLGEGTSRCRGEINVLLCGDPGTAKSQMLQFVHKIAPRGIYTSGKGSSAVGLTAYVTKDPDTGEMVLESGALVLSDRGVCCIDEFDKMADTTRSILHEVMEQQTVSIAKAGIVASLNARTSILASANPVNSRYDPRRSVVENINMQAPLLSRFDLIFIILDEPNEMLDRRLASHLVSLYWPDREPLDRGEFLPTDLLTRYVTYARKHVRPRLSDEAASRLVEAYVQMREVGRHGHKKTITATARNLQSMIRLSEALAKMRLDETVRRSDVEEAVRLINVAMQTAATDPTTGLIDMDLLVTGHSSADRTRDTLRAEALRDVLRRQPGPRIKFGALLNRFNEQSDVRISNADLRQLLGDLAAEGAVEYDSRSGVVVRRSL